MKRYEELILMIKAQGTSVRQDDYLEELSKIIEQLQRERDAFICDDLIISNKEYERVCKERDAAVDTLGYLAFEQNASVHKFCKNWTNHGCCCYDEHGNIIHECSGWEWRGIVG